ncbi:replicative DNA helicase loader DnaB [Oceanobacillus limi]|uniref:Replicative DNA helicase loader DnaB n=1 Tax=Oceanobacillus limi TaxID=930131 RepID=A0A1I0EGV8_9BACI|nr:DnaD domain protein [Oceanobacillus limi]SET44333.1 replicative DNA helicase loader DnaB [Oceanobacillus limi]
MNFIGKILPIDGYHVTFQGNALPIDYTQSLTHLYQPLIGVKAVMLYQTLLHEIELQTTATKQTHHTLMNYLNIPLDEIYESRLKLEGIGLLKTIKSDIQEQTLFTYVLKSPFAPSEFFKDGMLPQLLFHHIGDHKFHTLKAYYGNTEKVEEGSDITVSFHDVFDTLTPIAGNKEPVSSDTSPQGPNIEEVDFTWMEQMLKQRMIPVKNVLTKNNKRVMNQMMVLYDLAMHEIEKSLLWALTDENTLNIDEFINACHDTFKSKQGQAKVQLVEKSVQKVDNQQVSKPLTKEEQLIKELETMSPKQLLEDLSSGSHASDQDLKVIREVMTTQGLPSPVMNVLIHYVLLQSNMKLSKAYLEKIASHWSRANLKSAKEAMAFAKREKDRYRQGTTQKQNTNYYKKQQSTEVIPDWFKDRKNKKGTNTARVETADDAQKQARIDAIQQKFSSRKNNNIQG